MNAVPRSATEIAQAAFEGALFLLDAAPVIHRFAERTVTDAVLGRGGPRPLGITLTVDPGGILIVGKPWTRVRGRAFAATEAELQACYALPVAAMYRLDRDTGLVRLTCELDQRWLSGMTIGGAERHLEAMQMAHCMDGEAVIELVRIIDIETAPGCHTPSPSLERTQ